MKILVLAANTSTVLLDPCRNVPFVSTFPMYVYVCPEPVLTNIPQNIPNIPGFTWKYKNRRRERHFRTVFAQQHVAIKLDGVTAKQLRHRPQDARMQHDVIYCAAPIGKIARERLRVALRDSEATSDLRRIPAENASVSSTFPTYVCPEPVLAKRSSFWYNNSSKKAFFTPVWEDAPRDSRGCGDASCFQLVLHLSRACVGKHSGSTLFKQCAATKTFSAPALIRERGQIPSITSQPSSRHCLTWDIIMVHRSH